MKNRTREEEDVKNRTERRSEETEQRGGGVKEPRGGVKNREEE